MLHILLLLLKIIGIIILCILGTIIFVLLCILCVPVCYRIEVSRSEGENEPPVVVRAKVTWLLHFVNVLMIYSTELYLRARLLFIPVFRLPQKEKKRAGKRKKKEKRERKKEKREEKREKIEEEEEKREEKRERIEEEEEKREEKRERIEEKEEKREEKREKRKEKEEKKEEKKEERKKIEKIQTERRKIDIEETATPRQVRDEKKKGNFVHKLRELWEKVHNFIENIQYTIRNICDKIKSVWNDIQYYSDVVKSDVFQNTFILCKKELCRLLKGVLPGTFEADLVVGMDDPAATGQILAVCGMLYPVLGGRINVAGDFEQKRLEGSIFMKGRIYGITLLYVCVKIYFNKNVKKLYKLLKKEAV